MPNITDPVASCRGDHLAQNRFEINEIGLADARHGLSDRKGLDAGTERKNILDILTREASEAVTTPRESHEIAPFGQSGDGLANGIAADAQPPRQTRFVDPIARPQKPGRHHFEQMTSNLIG
nr:hypothetical protein [Lichenihabitans sp. PAMC28606]